MKPVSMRDMMENATDHRLAVFWSCSEFVVEFEFEVKLDMYSFESYLEK